MIVGPVSVRDPLAIRDALLSHGWEGDLASLTAAGLEISAYQVRGVPFEALQAMVPLAAKLGLELVTGDDWLILAGPNSRLGAFARPWVQPEPVQEIAQLVGMAMPAEAAVSWTHANGTIDLMTPVTVGIVNATPDSFSEASRVGSPDEALVLVEKLLQGGAAVVDVGGESTRPGASPLSSHDEANRVVPVIAAIAREHPQLPISVDTVNSSTAKAAIDVGAMIVNDVTSGRHDPELLKLAATNRVGIVLSHSTGVLGTLADYSNTDTSGDVAGSVVASLSKSAASAVNAGVGQNHIVVDPGFGFGKPPRHNWQLLRQLDAVVGLGYPVMVGLSRKRFLSDASDIGSADRDRATAAALVLAADRGAKLFRVHNPAAVREELTLVGRMHDLD